MSEVFWTVPREWSGETAFLLAGGPSLRGFDAEILRGRRVIAINNSYLLAPWADVLYYCDRQWWEDHRERALATFTGKYRVSLGTSADGTLRLQTSGPRGLEKSPIALRSGSNSGYQAINLAVHFGVSRIVLLGYDMHTNGPETHWHAGHPRDRPGSQEEALQNLFLPRFKHLVEPLRAEGIEVINATPDSALKLWPFIPLEKLL